MPSTSFKSDSVGYKSDSALPISFYLFHFSTPRLVFLPFNRYIHLNVYDIGFSFRTLVFVFL